MSERKIRVPEGMLEAVIAASHGDNYFDAGDALPALEAALRWLAEHPVVPTMEQAVVLRDLDTSISAQYGQTAPTCASVSAVVTFWQSHMFLVPEPEVPEEIKDLLVIDFRSASQSGKMDATILNERVIEAFRRGQKAGVR